MRKYRSLTTEAPNPQPVPHQGNEVPHRVPVVPVAGGIGCLALLALASPAALALAGAVATALEDSHDLIAVLVRIGLVLGFVALVLGVLGVARWVWRRATLAGVIRLPGEAPIFVEDLRVHGARLAERSLQAHYEVEKTAAAASQWHGTSHYAPSIRYDSRNEVPALEAPTLEVAPPVVPSLGEAVQRGLCGPDKLFVGVREDGSPAQITLARCGLIAVAGLPGSGKTVTASSLIAQAVHAGAAVFVADPHGEVAGGLLEAVRPLSGGFERQAVRPDEIAAMARLVALIARRRLDGLDAADQPVVYCIDEFLSLIARGVLPDDTLTDLLTVALEARKVRVHGIVISQNWTARAMPAHIGAMLRTAATHRLVHRADETTAAILLPSSDARRATSLATGNAVVLGEDGQPSVTRVPLLSADDLRFAARGKPEKPYQPRRLPPPINVPALPVAVATVPPTLAQRIVATLEASPQPLTLAQLEAALQADKQQVQNALTKLYQGGEVQRVGNRGNFTYTLPTPPPATL
jgi:hypothetical protein